MLSEIVGVIRESGYGCVEAGGKREDTNLSWYDTKIVLKSYK